MRSARLSEDPEVAVDACAILLGSVAISLASDQLVWMTLFVPALLLVRFAAWRSARQASGVELGAEGIFFALCIVMGGFNDWNSVVNHKIYDYSVPVFFPSFSTIPIWMLLFWGMILRFLLTLATWRRLGPAAEPSNTVRVGRRVYDNAWLKVGLQLALVLMTRQCIYRFYLDPVLSWLPFLLAAVLYALLFGLDAHGRRLGAVILVGGPCVEVLYIHVGGLHHYHLGWLGGVPLWIALWWAVALMVWGDLGRRIQRLVDKTRVGGNDPKMTRRPVF